jgi:hypothetical protein
LLQGRDVLGVEHGTNAEQYGARDENADAGAGFQECNCGHTVQCVLLVLFYPLQDYVADVICLDNPLTI